MVKFNTELFGRAAGFVSPFNDSNSSACLFFEFDPAGYADRTDSNASVDAGPESSMLPISKRRSSMYSRGFSIFVKRSSSLNSSRKAEGWTLIKTRLWIFFSSLPRSDSLPASSPASTLCFDSGSQIRVDWHIGRWTPALSLLKTPVQARVPCLHLLPLSFQQESCVTPIFLRTLTIPA